MSNVLETTYSAPAGKLIEVVFPVFLFQEDDIYFSYSPQLEINGYGLSEHEAKSSFDVMLAEFLEYTIKRMDNSR